jgi:hypothetical protein
LQATECTGGGVQGRRPGDVVVRAHHHGLTEQETGLEDLRPVPNHGEGGKLGSCPTIEAAQQYEARAQCVPRIVVDTVQGEH